MVALGQRPSRWCLARSLIYLGGMPMAWNSLVLESAGRECTTGMRTASHPPNLSKVCFLLLCQVFRRSFGLGPQGNHRVWACHKREARLPLIDDGYFRTYIQLLFTLLSPCSLSSITPQWVWTPSSEMNTDLFYVVKCVPTIKCSARLVYRQIWPWSVTHHPTQVRCCMVVAA